MSCYVNLLRCSSSTRQICRSFKSFSFIHQNSANVISKRNGTNLLIKRFKTTDSIPNKAAGEVKAQKVKLKASDLMRLLSLAKTEKWKISGKYQEFCASFTTLSRDLTWICIPSCNRMSNHILVNHNGCPVWLGQNPRYYLQKRDYRWHWSSQRKIGPVSLFYCATVLPPETLIKEFQHFQVLLNTWRDFHTRWFGQLWKGLLIQQCLWVRKSRFFPTFANSLFSALRITKALRERLYDRIMRHDCAWFDTKGTGELVNRLSVDTYMVGNSLSQNLSDGLRSTAMVIAGTGMMVYTSPSLALVGMCVVPCVAGMAVVYGRYLRNITREFMDKLAEVMKVGEERLGNVKTVKIFSKENYENKLFSKELQDMIAIGYRETKARAIFYGMTGLSGNVIIMSVLYYGGNLVNDGQMTIGALTSFILYAGYTAISLGGLSNFYTELNKGVGSATRIWEILDRKPTIPIHGGLIPSTVPQGEISFENISFNYPTRADADVLTDLSMDIKAGTITAVVGRSGSGKSSIASLLMRLYDPQSGKIFLDGHNLKDLDPSWLRRNIGAVNQEPVLFSGSIRFVHLTN